MQATTALHPSAVAILNQLEASLQPATQPGHLTLSEQILDAFDNTKTYTAQLLDPESKAKWERRINEFGVHGSIVYGVHGCDDVERLLRQLYDLKEVVASLPDPKIRVIQGKMPSGYNATTAYSSVREIAAYGGDPAVDTIKAKIGRQRKDDYYQCTLMPMPTNDFTVQLRKDDDGVEHFHQCFPGVEVSSRLIRDFGDTVVRCGVRIGPMNRQPRPARSNQRAGTQ
jgi:hypothetical protein